MSDNVLDLVKGYRDGAPLTQAKLDSLFDAIQVWATLEVRNRKQIMADCFAFGYQVDNDGNANLTKSLEDQILFPNKNILHYDFIDTAGNLSATTFHNIWWVAALTNGTATITNTLNGNLRLATTNAGVADVAASYRFAAFDPLNYPSVEIVLKLDDITTAEVYAGWRSIATPTDDYAYFKFNSATDAGNIYVATRNNGAAEVATDSLVNLASATAVKFRIQLAGISTIKFYINDVHVAQSHTGSIDYLTDFVPFIQVKNKVNEVRNVDVDHVRVVQNRSV